MIHGQKLLEQLLAIVSARPQL